MAGRRAGPIAVILAPFRPVTIVAILTVGVVGVLIAGLQPQLLGALAQEGRVTPAVLGLVASAELLAMGVGAGAGGLLLDRVSLRAATVVATGLLAVCDLATPHAGGGMIVAVRTLAGLGEGTLIGIAIGFVVRTAAPARWSGIYLAIQTLAQFALATMLGLRIVPILGADGGFQALAVVSLAALLAVPWLPARYTALPRGDDGGRVPIRGWIALGGVLLYLAFVVAVWVYVEPIARDQGIGGRTVALIAPLSLVMQVAGAGVATVMAERAGPARTIGIGVAANLLLLAAMDAHVGAVAFLVATSAFGFLWLFAMPFQLPLVIAADPSRRAATLIGGAQLIGSSAGPFVAGIVVGDGRLATVLWFSGVCAVLAATALIGAGYRTAKAARRNDARRTTTMARIPKEPA